jgi:adenosylcobinamide kinase/adenosylcobinamide-phosphate guanylyltransferase
MITLILGGARSGKSSYAERLAISSGRPVTYVATAATTGDPDFDARVRRHRERRPPAWRTEEPGAGLVDYLESEPSDDTLLIDSLGTWLAAHRDFDADWSGLCSALTRRRGRTIVVSEEVGLGVHPSTEVGGRFRDALGEVNQAVARIAGDAYLVVAGRVLTLEQGP